MRQNKPVLTPELRDHLGGQPVWRAEPFTIPTYRQLVSHVARLAYNNPDVLLFFRGQDKDYQSKAGGSTLYPSIYRGDAVAAREIRYRFEKLDKAARLLRARFKKRRPAGHKELRQKLYVQWSILQHYGVVDTPLLDFTHSLRVACSFAQLHSTDHNCYVYAVGLPYVTNRISINSEHDIVNIRLLSICPPDALRPYFQEGYLVGTTDITTEFDSKTELDFRNRLVAKFQIRRTREFWGSGFDPTPEAALFPQGDKIEHLCEELKGDLPSTLFTREVGEFMQDWAWIEERLLRLARQITEKNVSVREAIFALGERDWISEDNLSRINELRMFRNQVVHDLQSVGAGEISKWLWVASDIRSYLQDMEN